MDWKRPAGRSVLAYVALACVALLATPCGAHAEAPAPVRLGKGVSLHMWFTWPNGARADGTFAWPPFQKQDGELDGKELRGLHAAGFDFVRLTIDPAPFIVLKNRSDQLYQQLGVTLHNIRAAGLKVILDVHPKTSGDYPWSTAKLLAGGQKRHQLMGVETALTKLADTIDPAGVLVELINEPDVQCPSDQHRWPQQIEDLYRAARSGSTRVTIVIPAICTNKEAVFSNIPAAVLVTPTLVTVHYYDPYLFTAQGQKGEVSEAFAGLSYPSEPDNTNEVTRLLNSRLGNDRDALAKAKDRLQEYASTYNTTAAVDTDIGQFATSADAAHIAHDRVLLGEFSVNRAEPGAPGASGVYYRRWLSQVRTDAEKLGLPWCFWAYTGWDGMTLVKSNRDRTFDKDAACSLGLAVGGAPCAPSP